MTDEEAKEQAELHWVFLEKWLHMVFVDAWIHSRKHTIAELENKERENG